MSPEEQAQLGIQYIREAILDVLLESTREGRLIGPTEITYRLRLPGGNTPSHRGWVAFGFIQDLVAEGRVVQYPYRGYELAEREYTSRRQRRGK